DDGGPAARGHRRPRAVRLDGQRGEPHPVSQVKTVTDPSDRLPVSAGGLGSGVSRSVVVLVSGGAAVTPYTTPSAAARQGQAAGNTMTALRARLLAAGHEVYTAPARIGVGEVREDTGWEGFGDVPEILPAALTINAVGEIDAAGAKLAAFLDH